MAGPEVTEADITETESMLAKLPRRCIVVGMPALVLTLHSVLLSLRETGCNLLLK